MAAARFAPFHKWDRNFYLILLGLIWLGILMGFGGDIANHIKTHAPPFPLIVHVHAVAFVGWLVLLTVQMLLIRRQRHDIHRKLGVAGAFLAAIMIVLAPATALYMQRLQFGTPLSDPGFMAIQFTDILAFAGLVIAAITFRGRSPAHKRLILLATIYISDAGFARWLFPILGPVFGMGLWGFWGIAYIGPDILLFGLGAYDLVTRRRLHPAYVLGAIWMLANQFTATLLYHDPAWARFAAKLVAH